MPKKLIVHTGLHKTGTSYAQAFFDQNQAKLSQAGVFYPTLSRQNHTSFVAWCRQGLQQGVGKQKDWLQEQFQTADSVLLSSEEFCTDFASPVRAEHYGRVCAPYETALCFVLRRQDTLLESVYAEVCKGFFNGTMHSIPYKIDFEKRLTPAIDSFGLGNVLALPYNRSKWIRGDIAETILEKTAGIQLENPDRPERKNESQSRRKTLFLASLSVSKELKKSVKDVVFSHNSIVDDGLRYCSSPSFRAALYGQYEESNRTILARFGVRDVDDFLAYDGQSDQATWRPALPLSPREIQDTKEVLVASGIAAESVFAAYNPEVFYTQP